MDIVTFLLQPHGAIPNNPWLPVIVYRAAVSGMHDLAAAFEAEFDRNGWTHSWRNGVFDYHHYHSHAHEVLGIARGHARLAIGGPGARELNVQQGDCLLLPSGTGHCKLDASDDFLVVGAYPPGQHADIKTEPPSEKDLASIASCPLPGEDPVGSGVNAIDRFWR